MSGAFHYFHVSFNCFPWDVQKTVQKRKYYKWWESIMKSSIWIMTCCLGRRIITCCMMGYSASCSDEGFLFATLETTSQEIFLKFWSKEIINLIFLSSHLFKAGSIQGRFISKNTKRERWGFLVVAVRVRTASVASCVELYSSQWWQEQLWLQSPCQLRDGLLWMICQEMSQLMSLCHHFK